MYLSVLQVLVKQQQTTETVILALRVLTRHLSSNVTYTMLTVYMTDLNVSYKTA